MADTTKKPATAKKQYKALNGIDTPDKRYEKGDIITFPDYIDKSTIEDLISRREIEPVESEVS